LIFLTFGDQVMAGVERIGMDGKQSGMEIDRFVGLP